MEAGSKRARKATASDVARAAGVSKWTVTRAFTPGASIAEDSRKRVLEAAERLSYRPNLLARSLATKSTQQVAVLVDDFANLHKLPFLEKLTAALQADGMVAMLININRHFSHVHALLTADQRQVDAVILLGTAFRDETLQDSRLNPATPPLFVLARESTIEATPSVTCDATTSMEEIGTYLWDCGYRRPGFMTGARSLSTALRRRRCFAAFWRRHGIAEVPELPTGSYDRHAAERALRHYLTTMPAEERIDVLMCENDVLALGAVDVARSEFGLRIPEDLAVVGYDGIDLTATPAYNITTYAQPLDDMVAVIMDMIRGRRAVESVRLPGHLIVRGST
jgi:LacI family transcriptional regulator